MAAELAKVLTLAEKGFSTGRKIYNDPRARKAASTIQALLRGAKARKATKAKYMRKIRNVVGEDPGVGLSKYNQIRSDGEVSFGANQLHYFDILRVPRSLGSTTFGLNTRERDTIFLTGFRICITLKHLAVINPDLYINIAVVSGKNRGALDGTDLFRSYQGNVRAQDFSDGTLNALDRHCLPINTDEFNVHYHDRKLLLRNADYSNSSTKIANNYPKTIWIPIRRQIRFEGALADSETKFSLMFWAGEQGASIAESNTAVANAFTAEWKVIAVFKEPSPVFKYTY